MAADFEIALRLARQKIKDNEKVRPWKEALLAQCKRLKPQIDLSHYWHQRLDKALSRGDFSAAEEYLAKIQQS